MDEMRPFVGECWAREITPRLWLRRLSSVMPLFVFNLLFIVTIASVFHRVLFVFFDFLVFRVFVSRFFGGSITGENRKPRGGRFSKPVKGYFV